MSFPLNSPQLILSCGSPGHGAGDARVAAVLAGGTLGSRVVEGWAQGIVTPLTMESWGCEYK